VIIVVGSTRGPKVEAVRRVLGALAMVAPSFAGAEIVPFDASVGAPPMPLSLDEMLEGARGRAQLALESMDAGGRRADYAVGLEGGIDLRRTAPSNRGFLMSWAYVTDGRRGAHGCGGAIEVPSALLEAVVERGIELSEAMDALSGERGVRDRQGAWGILTRGMLDRTGSFETALLNAFAPFYNPETYR
jgi:inosine/xanthosine triphosphatase